jgi:YggT family protein
MLYDPLLRLYQLIDGLIWFYSIVVIAAVIVSWLVAFGVLDLRNRWARQFVQVLDAVTEPVFRRVRRIVPALGGLDLSPIIVLIGLELMRIALESVFLLIAAHV